MATPTYTPIESKTLGSAAATVDFTNIPQTYTDLVLVGNFGISIDGESSLYRVGNSTFDTGTNYSSTELTGTGSSAISQRTSNATGARVSFGASSATALTTNTIIHFQNYANTTTYKTSISRFNTASGTYPGTSAFVSLWRSTSAINQIRLYLTGGNYLSGSTFTLYGIANAAIGAPKATGGIITYDNTYYYHTFGASGTFTPQQSLTADILVVAGGAGAGSYRTGGGGAGGLLGFASQSLSATGYTVTVGAGGAGGAESGSIATGTAGNNGSDSQFGSLTLVKGGGTGGWSGSVNGVTGGSGGGAIAAPAGSTAGSATSGQGNAGGTGQWGSPYYAAGGGGGAGAAGSNGTSASGGGAGGNGLSTYSSWGLVTGTGQNVSGTVYYAGGGAGGEFTGVSATTAKSGGYGGGGSTTATAGGSYNSGGSGAPNTGGGGAGSVSTDNANQMGRGGNGGSGVVIVRYLR